MTASPHTDRSGEDDDVFDARLASIESATPIDIAADGPGKFIRGDLAGDHQKE